MADEQLSVRLTSQDLSSAGFASFNRNLGVSQQGIERLGRDMGVVSARGGVLGGALASVGRIAAGMFAGFTLDRVVTGFIDFHRVTMEQVGGLGELADRVGVTTDELQAYQVAARDAGVTSNELNEALAKFNVAVGNATRGNKSVIETFERLGVKILDADGKVRRNTDLLAETARALIAIDDPAQRAALAQVLLSESGAKLSPLLRQLTGDIDDLVASAREQGQVVEREVIEKLDSASDATVKAEQQFRTLYATFAAPIVAEGLVHFNAVLKSTVREIEVLQKAWNSLTSSIGQSGAVDADRKRLAELQSELAAGGPATEGRESMIQEDIDRIQARIAQAEAGARSRALSLGTGLLPQSLPDGEPAPVSRGARNPTVAGGSGGRGGGRGGGGGSDRDRIQEGLNQIVRERQAAERALQQLVDNAGVPLKDLQEQVEMQKKVAEEIAKLGKFDPDDPRVKQIEAEALAREKAETALKRYGAAAQDAVRIERELGDGSLFLQEEMQRLNEALDTGRLSYEAYAVASKNARDRAEDLRLILIGQQGGIEGLAAGMEFAARQWERNNTVFQQGQEVFNASVDLMRQGLSEFVRTGKIDLQSLLASFAGMLLEMELRAAASGLFKGLGGGSGGSDTGSLIGGLISGIGSMLGFAEGGRPPVGVPSIVGERGPELFVPDASGTIIPGSRLAGGGDSVVINQQMMFGSDVSQATLKTWAAEIKAQTMAAVLEQKRRGGREIRATYG